MKTILLVKEAGGKSPDRFLDSIHMRPDELAQLPITGTGWFSYLQMLCGRPTAEMTIIDSDDDRHPVVVSVVQESPMTASSLR